MANLVENWSSDIRGPSVGEKQCQQKTTFTDEYIDLGNFQQHCFSQDFSVCFSKPFPISLRLFSRING